MNRYKKLLSNTVVIGIGTFGSKLLVFLLMPLYTAWLSAAEYGTAELIAGVSNFLIPIACVGISNGIFRFAAEKNADRIAVFSSGIALLGIGLGAFLLLSPIMLTISYFRDYVWLIVLYVLFADLQSVLAQYLRAVDRTILFAGQGILNTCLTVCFNVLFLFVFRMGVTGYVLSVVLGNLFTSAFIFVRARLWTVFKPSRVARGLMRSMLLFSLPLIPTTVCWLITDISDRFMVTYFCGETVNGLYSAAYKIPTVITLFASIFLQAWQFSAVSESENEEARTHFYTQVFSGFLSLITLGTGALLLLSKPLTALLLNNSYFEAWRYMPMLLCSAAFMAIVSFLASVYLVRKKSTNSFVTSLVGAVVNILLNLLLIPRMGALGAAVATLASYLLVMVIRLLDVRRMIPFSCAPLRLALSTVGVCLMAVLIAWEVSGAVLWASVLFVGLLACHLPTLFKTASALLGKRRMT